ncbi:hypothetical protein EJ02DRAFT_241486 [Clathrospora elynae]|uniref:Uncharacterized protein n=1 Tax=Clathrospora elynae TaxID=706981 RepID=A0A6A5SN94_9PLEO|nr:hypothetical protein EJ02DRAFT_241486 [Clathrospora elynae]
MSERPSLMPPTGGSFLSSGAHTPSGLTPCTRSEAEAALTHNSIAQTDSAAPDPTLLAQTADGSSEAQQAYRRPDVARTSSTNYENALKRAQQASVSSSLSANSVPDNITGETVASPVSSTTPFPPPGQGVVPLNYGAVSAVQGDALKKTRPRGLSLSGLAQQQGWSEQDFKRVYSADLLQEEPKQEAGYDSGSKPDVA